MLFLKESRTCFFLTVAFCEQLKQRNWCIKVGNGSQVVKGQFTLTVMKTETEKKTSWTRQWITLFNYARVTQTNRTGGQVKSKWSNHLSRTETDRTLKEERGKRKEERGKEEKGKRKEERGKEERGFIGHHESSFQVPGAQSAKPSALPRAQKSTSESHWLHRHRRRYVRVWCMISTSPTFRVGVCCDTRTLVCVQFKNRSFLCLGSFRLRKTILHRALSIFFPTTATKTNHPKRKRQKKTPILIPTHTHTDTHCSHTINNATKLQNNYQQHNQTRGQNPCAKSDYCCY